jgi:hypothetical protein
VTSTTFAGRRKRSNSGGGGFGRSVMTARMWGSTARGRSPGWAS